MNTTTSILDDNNAEENTLDMCCGGKKCPVVVIEGDELVVTDNGQRVSFTREQWHQLRAWMAKKCF